jgi:hypothetical protein
MYGKIMADPQAANEESGPEGILLEGRVSGKCHSRMHGHNSVVDIPSSTIYRDAAEAISRTTSASATEVPAVRQRKLT